LCWVDDCLFLGNKDDVINAANDMKTYFECDNDGFTDTYVGCKMDMNKNKVTVTFKQPALLKRLMDESGIEKGSIQIPVTPGTVLQAGEVCDELKEKLKKKYQAGVGKLLYLAR
jgi:hypothetical protein